MYDCEQTFSAGPCLYQLLGFTDLLMTDYSLLQKPVLLFAPNFEEKRERICKLYFRDRDAKSAERMVVSLFVHFQPQQTPN